jgi:hypothetical protein
VHEVALGNADMCVANSWVTTERLAIAGFSNSIYTDIVRLVATKRDDGALNVGESLRLVFEPLSYGLWLALAFSMVYFALSMWLLEGRRKQAGDSFPQKTHTGRMLGAIGTASSALAGYTFATPVNPLASLAVFGFGINILFISVSYQNGALLLRLKKDIKTDVDSFSSAITQRSTFCIVDSMVVPIVARYPASAELLRPVATFIEVTQGMESGLCDAGLMTEDYWTDASLTDNQLCDSLHLLKEPVLTIPVAIAAADEWLLPLTWDLERVKEEGMWDLALASAEIETGWVDKCKGVEEDPYEHAQMDLDEGVGPCMLSVLLSTAAVIATLVLENLERTSRRKRQQAAAALSNRATKARRHFSSAGHQVARAGRAASAVRRATQGGGSGWLRSMKLDVTKKDANPTVETEDPAATKQAPRGRQLGRSSTMVLKMKDVINRHVVVESLRETTAERANDSPIARTSTTDRARVVPFDHPDASQPNDSHVSVATILESE